MSHLGLNSDLAVLLFILQNFWAMTGSLEYVYRTPVTQIRMRKSRFGALKMPKFIPATHTMVELGALGRGV